jgi:two-component system LytT family sensor kinase
MKSVSGNSFFLLFSLWTLLGCLSAAMWIIQLLSRGQSAPWLGLIVGEILYWYAWGIVMSLVVVRLAKWFPIVEAKHDARKIRIVPLSLVLHFPMSFVLPFITFCCSFLFSTLYSALTDANLTFGTAFSLPSLHTQLVEQITSYYLRMQGAMMGVLTYWASLAMLAAKTYFSQMQSEATRRTQLETALARAELSALKMQVQPHFLFNTLNSISSLLQTEPSDADRMIARLGEFFRVTLESGEREFVPLQEEVHFARLYLEIEQVRFADRLTFDIDITPETVQVLVPNLILQPLVENAIKHGLSQKIAAGTIWIQARINTENQHKCLILTVSDNGRGVQGNASNLVFGVGLANVASRLSQLYGEDASMQLEHPSTGGFTALLSLPFQTTFPSKTAHSA